MGKEEDLICGLNKFYKLLPNHEEEHQQYMELADILGEVIDYINDMKYFKKELSRVMEAYMYDY